MFPPNASELAMLDGVYPELTSKLPDAVPNTMTLALGALGTMAAIGKTALPVALVVPFMKYIAKSVKRASPQEENPHDASPSDIIPPEDLPLEPLYTNIIDHGLDFGGPHLKTLKSVPKVIIIGAGCAGLSAAFELKRAGANVVLLESSERVGGRVKTYGPGTFAAGLHCEGGAMRIPANNYMTLRYFKLFGIEDKLEKFEQTNRVIYLKALGRALPYHEFEQKLHQRDPEILKLYPGLKESEKGKTIDELWNEALIPIHETFFDVFDKNKDVTAAYAAVTTKFDHYTLKSYLEQVGGWSADAIRLYCSGHAIVVLDNGIIETWKDEFLCSPQAGVRAEMRSVKGGMEVFAQAFTTHPTVHGRLDDDIRYCSTVFKIAKNESGSTAKHDRVSVFYHDQVGVTHEEKADFIVMTVPYTSLRTMETVPAFDVGKADCISKLRYVNVAKILLQFKKRWWEKWLVDNGMIPPEDAGSRGGGVVTDLAIRHIMFPNHQYEMFKNTERGVIMAAYVFQEDATAISSQSLPDIIRLAKRNLAQIVGDEKLIEDNFERGVVQSWSADQAGGGAAFVFFGPSQKTELYDDLLKPQWSVDGESNQNLVHFAGEHASFSHGWIQGAFESSIRVTYDIYQSWVDAQRE